MLLEWCYENWKVNEPNNRGHNGNKEEHMAMNKYMTWNDANQDSLKFVLCEYEIWIKEQIENDVLIPEIEIWNMNLIIIWLSGC